MYSVIQRRQDVDTLVCIYITSILVAVFEIVCASSCTVFIFSLFCYTNEFARHYQNQSGYTVGSSPRSPAAENNFATVFETDETEMS